MRFSLCVSVCTHRGLLAPPNASPTLTFGVRVPAAWDSNYEWQVCAAKGWLRGQGSNTIRFAYEPRDLRAYSGPHPLGSCSSYAPKGCSNGYGYGSGDIFYLEVCIFETICANAWELYQLDVGDDFHCTLSAEGFIQLKNWLLYT